MWFERKRADDGYGGCSLRLQVRWKNRAVTELGEVLTPMPLSVSGDETAEAMGVGVVPRTGEEVRKLHRAWCSIRFSSPFHVPFFLNPSPIASRLHLRS